MEAANARKAPMIADNESEQFEEFECEDHYKEPKPEELSLLGNSCDQVSQSLRRLSVGNNWNNIIDCLVLRNKLLGSKSAKSSSRPVHQSSIQIASNESERMKLSSDLVSCNLSSCHSSCGPNPSKITLICLLVSSQKIFLYLLQYCHGWKLWFYHDLFFNKTPLK